MKLTHDKIERNVGLLVILTVLVISVGGLLEIVPLFFQKSTTTPVAGLKPYDAVRLAGWVLLLLGLVIALVAIGLSKGSNFLRILLAIILLFRIGGDIWLILNANYDPAVWLSMAFNLFILYLLFNAKASAFFDQ